MNSNKILDLARKAYPYDNNLRVAYMLGLEEGHRQTSIAFMEKAEKYLEPHIQSILLGDMHDTSVFVQNFKNYMQNESEN